VIDLSDFLKTAVTLAGFQNDEKHIFLRDKLNSLQSGRQIWKPANVTAVFKKSDKSITSYYRPISLFSCVSRIFERTVFKYVLTISVDINI
jgi:hypothetical protein